LRIFADNSRRRRIHINFLAVRLFTGKEHSMFVQIWTAIRTQEVLKESSPLQVQDTGYCENYASNY